MKLVGTWLKFNHLIFLCSLSKAGNLTHLKYLVYGRNLLTFIALIISLSLVNFFTNPKIAVYDRDECCVYAPPSRLNLALYTAA